MKKIFAGFMILAMLLSFAACGKKDTAKENGTHSAANALVYEKDGITITSEGFEDGALSLKVENSGEADVLVAFPECTVNGYMAECTLQSENEPLPGSVVTPAGETKQVQLVPDSEALTRCGIEQVGYIAFCVSIKNPENFEQIDYSESVQLYVSAGVEQAYDEEGTLAFNKGGIKIVVKGFDPADESKTSVLVYVANGSENSIDISAENVKIGDKKVTAIYSADVLPGMHSVGVMRFEKGVKDIKQLQLSFCINRFDFQTGEIQEVIAKSKAQSVKF